MFCEKLQNVYSVAANPQQMDKNEYDFWTQRPPKPLNPLQPSSILYIGVMVVNGTRSVFLV